MAQTQQGPSPSCEDEQFVGSCIACSQHTDAELYPVPSIPDMHVSPQRYELRKESKTRNAYDIVTADRQMDSRGDGSAGEYYSPRIHGSKVVYQNSVYEAGRVHRGEGSVFIACHVHLEFH